MRVLISNVEDCLHRGGVLVSTGGAHHVVFGACCEHREADLGFKPEQERDDELTDVDVLGDDLSLLSVVKSIVVDTVGDGGGNGEEGGQKDCLEQHPNDVENVNL